MITINFKAKMTEKAQFTNVNEHFEIIFNVEIGRKGGFAKASNKVILLTGNNNYQQVGLFFY